jgi:uncharacterized protein YciI
MCTSIPQCEMTLSRTAGGSGCRYVGVRWYERPMAMFLVTLHRSGPDWQPARPLEEQSGWAEHAAFMDSLVEAGVVVLGGPLADEHRVVLAVEADSADAVRAALAPDPWRETHLALASVEPWTIRLRRGPT